jgi:hypothetical protein
MQAASSTRTISSLWVGEPPSSYEYLCLLSFAHAGHTVNLYTYDPSFSVPEGVQGLDAREILPEDAVFRNRDREFSFALFANWFRATMIQKTGAAWVDTDILLLSALPDTEYLYAWVDKGKTRVNNALLGAPSDSRLVLELVDRLSRLASPDEREVPWGTFGPVLLTEKIFKLGLQNEALDVEQVYPIGAPQLWRMFDPKFADWCREQTRDAIALHLWNSKIQAAGVKHLAPPKGSFLDALMIEHGVRMPDERMTREWATERRELKEGVKRASRPAVLAQKAGAALWRAVRTVRNRPER